MANGRFGGGSGTIEDPYLIEDIADFVAIKNNLNSSFKLVCNINLGVYPYNIGDGWEPIRNFSGTIDGNHKKIRNLTISRPLNDNVGLFGNIKLDDEYSNRNFFMKNFMLEDVNISGKSNTGALVGFIEHTPVSNIQYRFSGITASGKINAYGKCIGGIAGKIESKGEAKKFNFMCNCISKIDIDLKSSVCNYIGGLTGLSSAYGSESYYSESISFANCLNAGHINKHNFEPGVMSSICYYWSSGPCYFIRDFWDGNSGTGGSLISDTIAADGLASIKNSLDQSFSTDDDLKIPVWNFKKGRLPELICESSDLIFIYDDKKYKTYDFVNNEWIEVSDDEPTLMMAMKYGMKYIDYIPSSGWMSLKDPLNAYIYNVTEKRCVTKNNHIKISMDKTDNTDRAVFKTTLSFKNKNDNSTLAGIYV